MSEHSMRDIAQGRIGDRKPQEPAGGGRAGREEEIWIKKEYLLFDLDGTLTDPKLGITSCVQYALHSFGIEEPDLDKLEPFIGPPLKESFQTFYGFDSDKADEAVAKYRERFKDTGIFENEIYRGVPEMLKKLKFRGIHLGIASSKPTVYVERILEHFHIREYFDVVVGSELDGTRVEKAEVILEALRQFFPDGNLQKQKVFMIGDRKHDVAGAHAVGVESVGVTFGYGGMEELMEAHSDYIVRSVEELRRFLLRGYEDMEKDLNHLQKVWIVMYHLILYIAARGLVQSLGNDLLGKRGAVALSDDMQTLLFALGSVVGGALIFRSARRTIKRTIRDMYLTHLKWEPKSAYGLLALAVFGLSQGGIMLLGVTGIVERTNAYSVIAQEGRSCSSLLAAFITFGVISPIAQELLFRGVIYGYVRRFFDVKTAIIGTAILCGVFSGNMTNLLFTVPMGYLIAYAYEYFGDFKVPLFAHIGVKVLTVVIAFTGLGATGFVCLPVCIALLLLGGGALFFLARRKRVL